MTELKNAGFYRDNTTLNLQAGSFDSALREAVRARGLTLDRLRSHLARRGISVGLSSLSDWQHGRSRPGSPKSLQAVNALEEILGLHRNTLIGLLAKAQPPDTWNRARSRSVVKRGLDESKSPFAELLRDFAGAPADDGLDIVTRHQIVKVDTQRRSAGVLTRSVVRAKRDGVDRYLVRFTGDPGCDLSRVSFSDMENCRLGRIRRHPTEPVLVAEMLFDEVLSAGETWVYQYRIADPSGGATCEEFGHGFVRPESQYILEIRFDPHVLPTDVHAYTRPTLNAPRRRTGTLSLNRHHGVHLVASDVCAGLIGIAWSWPDSPAR